MVPVLSITRDGEDYDVVLRAELLLVSAPFHVGLYVQQVSVI